MSTLLPYFALNLRKLGDGQQYLDPHCYVESMDWIGHSIGYL